MKNETSSFKPSSLNDNVLEDTTLKNHDHKLPLNPISRQLNSVPLNLIQQYEGKEAVKRLAAAKLTIDPEAKELEELDRAATHFSLF